MSTIQRDDQLSFAVHVYRTSLAWRSRAVLGKKIRALAEHHGHYIRVMRKARQLEVVLSKEPGFLLGEAVWQYFGEPKNMIYCEALPGLRQVLLVVVRDSQVYVDTQCTIDQLATELIAVLAAGQSYQWYCYGRLPIFDQRAPAALAHWIQTQSVQLLEASVFRSLAANPQYQLQSLEVALRTQRVGHINGWPWLLVLLGIAIGWSGWSWWASTVVSPPVVTASVNQAHNVNFHYQHLLAGPSVLDVMHEVTQTWGRGVGLSGWAIKQLNWHDGVYDIRWQSRGGSMVHLASWAKHLGGTVSMSTSGAQVHFRHDLPVQRAKPRLRPLAQWQAELMDQLAIQFPHAKMVMAAQQAEGQLARLSVKIILADTSPLVLDLLARQLVGVPVRIDLIQLQQRADHISGLIQMKMVGTIHDNH